LFFSYSLVLARILAERNMIASPLGNLVMGATAIDDVMAWIVLAIVVAIVRSTQELNILYTILLAIADIVVMYFVIKPIIFKFCGHITTKKQVTPKMFFFIFAVLLTVSWFCEAVGLSALVGAFQVGLSIPRNEALLLSLSSKLEDFIVIIIMPLFFTNSGLRTNFFLLNDGEAW
jgi:Kef-type K+ transport system membrane component KefB